MSTEPLLPPFRYQTKRKSSVVTAKKLLAVLFLVTAANVFSFTHPQTSAQYISKVHHRVAKWTSYPAIVNRVLDNGDSTEAGSKWSEAGQISYEWKPSGRTGPLSSEPGIDHDRTAFNPEFEESKRPRRITGGPGSDVWTREDVDEDLETIFNTEDFITSDQVRAPATWRTAQEESGSMSDNDRPTMTWAEIEQTLEEYAPKEDAPKPLTGEALWQFIEERIDWDERHPEGESSP